MIKFSPIATKILYSASAWLIGSATEDHQAKDIDIVVSFRNWPMACLHIPPTAKPNSFGGWKFEDGTRTVDVWPADIVDIMLNGKVKRMYHYVSETMWERLPND